MAQAEQVLLLPTTQVRGCGRKLGLLEIGHYLQVKWEGAEAEVHVSSPEMRVGYCGYVRQRRELKAWRGVHRHAGMDAGSTSLWGEHVHTEWGMPRI